jgi:hypothetical protein
MEQHSCGWSYIRGTSDMFRVSSCDKITRAFRRRRECTSAASPVIRYHDLWNKKSGVLPLVHFDVWSRICLSNFQKERPLVKFCDILGCRWKFRMLIIYYHSPFPHFCSLYVGDVRISRNQLKTLFPSTVQTWVILHAVGVFVMQEKWFILLFPGDEINFTCVPRDATRPRVFCYYRHSASLWFSHGIIFWLHHMIILSAMAPFCVEYKKKRRLQHSGI